MKKIFKLALCAIMVMVNFFPAVAGINSVHAEEPELGKVINESSISDFMLRNQINAWTATYNYPAFYENMFAIEGVTEFNFKGKSIASLEGLEQFNLSTIVSIDFSDNKISNYDSDGNYVNALPESVFETATNLETLDLSGNLLQRVNIDTYAKYIDLSNNRLLYVTIWDNRLVNLNLSDNYISDSERIKITGVEPQDYDILAYNNFMAGKSSLTNAYLGVQNLTLYSSSEEGSDYELFSNSESYRIYVYPFKKVCVGKDANTNELIYKDIRCHLYLLDYESGVYNLEKIFNEKGTLPFDEYETYKPKSGYYRFEFLTTDGEHVYDLDSEYNVVTKTEKGETVKVVNNNYRDIILRAKPSESGNVAILYNGELYDHELSTKGPVTLKLYCSIPNVTYKYLLNGYGQRMEDNYIIPYEGDEIYLDKTSYYTLTVWIIENGAISDRINFALYINVPRKMSASNWFFLIAGGIVVIGGIIFYLYRANKNNLKKEINDFEW